MGRVENKLAVRQITFQKARFVTLVMIVLLGVAFYVGIKSTSPLMKATADRYFDDHELYDIELKSTVGFQVEDQQALEALDGVDQVFMTQTAQVELETEQERLPIKLYAYDATNSNSLNRPQVVEGRLPENREEIAVDSYFIEDTDFKLGDTITFDTTTLIGEGVTSNHFNIVGIVDSPIYISIGRGWNREGTESMHSFMVVTHDVFTRPKYSDIYLTIEKENASRYTKGYQEKVQAMLEIIGEVEREQLKAVHTIDPNARWIALTLNQNRGYVSFEQDSDRMASLADVFPFVFFLVAALVSLTTMTRIIENERIQIGTLKSLGYGDGRIIKKYIVYAFLATLLGSILGIILGVLLLPRIIFNAYGVLYQLPELALILRFDIFIQAMLFAAGMVILPTLVVCIQNTKEVPARLLVPKAPKPGKRIFLERLPFLWNHLNFTKKVTARNILRYKKRFFMTVIGIAGCTALLLTGYGLRDSIQQIQPLQFDELRPYDIEISIDPDTTEEALPQLQARVDEIEEMVGTVLVHQSYIDLSTEDKTVNSVTLNVPKDVEAFKNYVRLRKRGGEELSLARERIILTGKLAQLLKVTVGDPVTLHLPQGNVEVIVEGITENYVNHYLYIDPTYVETSIIDQVSYNFIFGKIELSDETHEENLAMKLQDFDEIHSLNFQRETEVYFRDMINTLNSVMWVLILSAGLLAFIVLFSLTNINIDERKRELATIKVLGFYIKEVASYIYRENIILTAIGALSGLGLGVILHRFVLRTVEVDILIFPRVIQLNSFLISLILTFLFAAIVNLIMLPRIKNIDMIESLKSVE